MKLAIVCVSSAHCKPKDITYIKTNRTTTKKYYFDNNNNRNDKVEKIEINEKYFRWKIV